MLFKTTERGKYHTLFRMSRYTPNLAISNCPGGSGFIWTGTEDDSIIPDEDKCKHCAKGPRPLLTHIDGETTIRRQLNAT